jgi:hypothetical protein
MEQRNRSPKRVRIDSQDSPHPETSPSSRKKQPSRRSPTKAAEEALERAVESLPTSLHKIILHYGRKIIEVRSKLHNKKQIAGKLNSDSNYIPKSAKATEFKITVSNAAMEDAEKIEFLQNMVEQAKQQYEGSLKNVVQECIQLEIKALKRQEKEITSDMLYGLASATITYAGANCDPHLRVNNLIEVAPYLFKFGPKTSAKDIRHHYCRHHTLETLPNPTTITITGDYASQEELLLTQQAAATATQRPENKGLQCFQLAVETILIIPTRQFLEQYDISQREIAMKRLAAELVEGKATEDTAMELDAEGAASHELLQDLIRKEVAKRDKKYDELNRKYQTLHKEMQTISSERSRGTPQKNGNPRGRQHSGTSVNKKKSIKESGNNGTMRNHSRSRSRSRNRNRNRNHSNTPKRQSSHRSNQARAPNDDSANERSGNSNRHRGSKQRSNLKRRTSNTRNNRRSKP